MTMREVEVGAGEHIWVFCERLRAAAPSWGLFNDTPTLAMPGETTDVVEKRWRRVRTAIQQQKGLVFAEHRLYPDATKEEADAILATLAFFKETRAT